MNLSRTASTASVTFALALAVGCGGPPAVGPTPVPSASASGTAIASPGLIPLGTDTSAVAEPASLVVVGRVASVAKALRTLHGWSQLPMPKEDSITELLTSEAVGALVDLDKSIDVAVAITGKGDDIQPLVAFSAALTDLGKAEEALQGHFKLTPDAGGTLHVDGLGRDSKDSSDDDSDDKKPKGDKPKDDENEQHRHCVLAPSAGDAPARLVCGISLASVHTLGPWLSRTLPRTPPSTDLTVDVRMAALKPILKEKKSLIAAGLEGAMPSRSGAFSGLMSKGIADLVDLAIDLDAAKVGVTLGDDSATATLSMTVSGTTSTLAHIMTSHPERTDVAPAAFWQLPGDADAAIFSRGIDANDIDGPRDAVVDAITNTLSLSGAAPADSKAIGDALRKFVTGSPFVFASGIDLNAVRRSLADQRRIDRGGYSSSVTPERLDARRAAAEALIGWRVLGVEGDPKAIASAAHDLATAWGRPGIAKAMHAAHKDGPVPSIRILPAPKGASLPAGSLHLQIDTYPFQMSSRHADEDAKKAKPAPPAKPLAIHVLIVPEAGRTWITIAATEQLALDKATSVLAGAPDDKKLAKRAGLEILRTAKIGGGGFSTQVGSSSTRFATAAISSRFYGAADFYDGMASEPHQGATPLVFTTTAQAGAGGGAGATATLLLPKAAIEDLVASFIQKVGSGSNDEE
jgi:hypothetical protein